jgi:hypothetical protein
MLSASLPSAGSSPTSSCSTTPETNVGRPSSCGDPTLLQFYRGWWCPKEQAFFPSPPGSSGGRGGRLREDRFNKRRPARGERGVPGRARSALDLPLRFRPPSPDTAETARDHRHAQRLIRARRGRDQPRSPHPRRIQRLLVLGATHPRRTREAPARHQPRPAPRLGGTDATSRCWLALVEGQVEGADAVAPRSRPMATRPERWQRGADGPSRCARPCASMSA